MIGWCARTFIITGRLGRAGGQTLVELGACNLLREQPCIFENSNNQRMVTMHRMHSHQTGGGPETTGYTLHGDLHYDFISSLMGLGVNRPNSRRVVELAKIKPGDKVLDVGCGTG